MRPRRLRRHRCLRPRRARSSSAASSIAFSRSRSTASSASSQPGSISSPCQRRRACASPCCASHVVDVLALPDLRLQRRERLGARLEVGERAGSVSCQRRPRRAGVPAASWTACAERVERRLRFAASSAVSCASCSSTSAIWLGHRGGEARAAPASSRSRRCASCASGPRVAFAPGLGDADRLLGAARCAAGARGDVALPRVSAASSAGSAAARAAALRSPPPRAPTAPARARLRRSRDRPASARLLPGERAQLLGELRHLLRDPRFGLARERELLLEARDLGVGRVEAALLVVQRVAGGVMVGAQRLEPRLGRAHLGLQRLRSATVSVAICGRVALARPRTASCCFANHSRCCDCLSRASSSRYSVATFACASSFVELVRRARCGCPRPATDSRACRRGGPRSPCAAPCTWRRPAASSRKIAQLLGLGLDHARDHSLLDDRVGARAEPGAEEEIVDVAAAHRDVVDVVGRVAVARQHALDRELGVLAPLAADAARAVVEEELDRRAAHRLALAGAVEDDVLHRLAAQRGRLRFAEHPAHGVDDVRLAAAVGADDADELARAWRSSVGSTNDLNPASLIWVRRKRIRLNGGGAFGANARRRAARSARAGGASSRRASRGVAKAEL